MGRKRSENSDNKMYFSQSEEDAIKEYLTESNVEKKHTIYVSRIHPSLVKLAECVIKRYKLFMPDEEFSETLNDCVGHIMEKFDMFKPDKGHKAYSYFGTIARHYMIYRLKKYHDNLLRNDKYDLNPDQYEESERYADEEYSIEQDQLVKTIVDGTKNMIMSMMEHKGMYDLSEGEMKIGEALLELFDNWDAFFVEMGSQKFNKASILLYLKETTLMQTKDIRKYMKKYKQAYERVKESVKMEFFN